MVIFHFVLLVYQRVSFPEFIGSTIPGLPGAITGPLNWVVPKLLLCCLQVVSYKPTSTRKTSHFKFLGWSKDCLYLPCLKMNLNPSKLWPSFLRSHQSSLRHPRNAPNHPSSMTIPAGSPQSSCGELTQFWWANVELFTGQIWGKKCG